MFGRIVGRYDLMNRLMTMGRDGAWRRATVQALAPSPSGRALDVGCGTGDLTRELARAGARLAIGLDPVHGMLDAAAAKLGLEAVAQAETPRSAGTDSPAYALVEGDGLRLPFPDASFEVVASAFVMRNVADLPAAIREMRRVLRPGGRIGILELTPMRIPILRLFFRLYFHRVVPLVGGLVTGDRDAYGYLPASVDRFLTASQLAGLLAASGFERVRYRRFMLGTVALHVGER